MPEELPTTGVDARALPVQCRLSTAWPLPRSPYVGLADAVFGLNHVIGKRLHPRLRRLMRSAYVGLKLGGSPRCSTLRCGPIAARTTPAPSNRCTGARVCSRPRWRWPSPWESRFMDRILVPMLVGSDGAGELRDAAAGRASRTASTRERAVDVHGRGRGAWASCCCWPSRRGARWRRWRRVRLATGVHWHFSDSTRYCTRHGY